MGDVGVATSPDINSMHWNPAKYAFIKGDIGGGLSYTPWLRQLVNDINLAYLTGYKKIDKYQTVAGSLLYFSLGEITYTRVDGSVIRPGNPNEFAIDLAYSRLFTSNFSSAIAFRYIYSDLSGGAPSNGGTETSPGMAVAVDVASYYRNSLKIDNKDAELAIGLNISNIGNKIEYSEESDIFIPTNMRLGTNLDIELDPYNSINFSVDFNKLLVPTNPEYYSDSLDQNGGKVVKWGKGNQDDNVPVAMIKSFYDAPGWGNEQGEKVKYSTLLEELREVTVGLGTEYWYTGQFAIRGGYFYEHATKGNRKFFSVGVGLKLNVFNLDVSYLISRKQDPLANTIRFSLLFDVNPELQ
jgi:hypothetical protein